MNKILIIFTCYNRKNITANCIRTLAAKNRDCRFTFVIADDGSTDGTYSVLHSMADIYDIHIIQGNGSWYYSKGMNIGMKYALEHLHSNFDYMLMINDDVEFFEGSIQALIAQSINQKNSVIAGTMCNDLGELSYGAIKYTFGYKYRKMDIDEWELPADTFNANCVLIPYTIFKNVGAMDEYYKHSLGDFDYGLLLKKNGYKIFPSKKYTGKCNNNKSKGTWMDPNLSRRERIRKKEYIKGAPTKQWFYFLRKNFGLFWAVKGTVTPFIRIMLKK